MLIFTRQTAPRSSTELHPRGGASKVAFVSGSCETNSPEKTVTRRARGGLHAPLEGDDGLPPQSPGKFVNQKVDYFGPSAH